MAILAWCEFGHLRCGNRPGKPQRESCWQEAAALHLSLKVSENTMRLSSALDSTFTSLHISLYALTHHWSCLIVSFSSAFLSCINLHALLHYWVVPFISIPTYTALRGPSAKVCHGSPLTLSPEAGEWKHILCSWSNPPQPTYMHCFHVIFNHGTFRSMQ